MALALGCFHITCFAIGRQILRVPTSWFRCLTARCIMTRRSADLPLRPKLLLNATTRNDHTRFTFTDETFQRMHSTLARYHVANAVNASSAFPGAFDDVTLEQYGMEAPRYVHLYDGGPMDNLGVQAMTEYLQRAVAGRALNDKDLFPEGCVIFVVDATPDTDNEGLAVMQIKPDYAGLFRQHECA